MKLSDKMKKAIEELSSMDIYGCISGSSMINGDYDSWDSIPDVDVFVYTHNSLVSTLVLLIEQKGYELANKREAWKFDKLLKRDNQYRAIDTLKVTKDGVTINVTYKKGCSNVLDVLSSFDMSIIMVGYDIPKKFTVDLRTGGSHILFDENKLWSTSKNVAVPNPLRDQQFDMYNVAAWVRQFDRCIKYWNRGYDTRPMAKFYINAVNSVINAGSLFDSEEAQNNYAEFCKEFEPMRDKMVVWLNDKEGI